ncbi:MAG: porphobilinogen synthase [Legionellales bacterium]|nr:porphobilinogen synthase [Legionellales bacterium]
MSFPSRRFPTTRLRRLRQAAWSRQLVQEHRLCPADLIWPVFIVEGEQQRIAIESMPEVMRLSIDQLLIEAQQAQTLGIPAIALFPVIDPALKTATGDEALNPDNLICRAIHSLRAAALDIGIICDVALDPYTNHGHDGVIINGDVDNDATVELLTQQAVIQAQAGCQIIAPSDMQDGRVGAIRQALDQAGFYQVMILAYAAKYCSHFYGPFRDALGSQQSLANKGKHTYQQPITNSDEALHEVALDLQEGADMVMVKPAMPYLDVIYRIKQTFHVPTFAYQVSGEYTMLHHLAQTTHTNVETLLIESLLSCKRAGSDAIITYAAKQIAQSLSQKN